MMIEYICGGSIALLLTVIALVFRYSGSDGGEEPEPVHYQDKPYITDTLPERDWTPTNAVPWQVKHTARELAQYIREERWRNDE
jgi:hypothetical protein